MMTQKELNDRQVQFGNNLEIMLTAIARSLRINGVPVDVINKAFFAGNAAVQMLGQKKNPSEEGMTG
jgi:uncharacterized protein with PIN domain